MKTIFIAIALLPALAQSAENKTLWNEWYLYSVGGEAKGYFEETLERRPGEKQLAITQKWVEKDGPTGGRSETYIGSVVQDSKALKPVAFFSERTGPQKSYKIDGRVKSGKLTITFTPIQPKGKPSRKSVKVLPGLHFSNFVPLLLAYADPAKGAVEFEALVEDAQDGRFGSRSGRADILGVTKKINDAACRKAIVEFDGIAGEWWFTPEGKLCEMQVPSSGSQLRRVTRAEAEKALSP